MCSVVMSNRHYLIRGLQEDKVVAPTDRQHASGRVLRTCQANRCNSASGLMCDIFSAMLCYAKHPPCRSVGWNGASLFARECWRKLFILWSNLPSQTVDAQLKSSDLFLHSLRRRDLLHASILLMESYLLPSLSTCKK